MVVGIVILASTANTPCWGTSEVSVRFWMPSSWKGGGTLRLN